MLHGRTYPTGGGSGSGSPSRASNSASVRRSSDGDAAAETSNALALPRPVPLRIMVWNIANLGGGFGYPIKRHDAVIAATAQVIDFYRPDVLVVLEIMRKANPPAEPRFYKPYSLESLRAEPPPGLEAGFADDADEIFGRMYRYYQIKESGAVPETEMSPLYWYPSTKAGMVEIPKDFERLLAGKHGRTKATVHFLREKSTGLWAIRVILAGKFMESIRDKVTGDMRRWFDETAPTGSELRELLETYQVTNWDRKPARMNPAHFDEDQKQEVRDNNKRVKAFEKTMRTRLDDCTAFHLYGAAKLGNLDESLRESASRVAERILGLSQYSEEAQESRRAAWREEVRRWNAANEESAHHGVREFKRIFDSLPHRYGCWPWTDAPATADGDKSPASADGPALDTTILYSDRETCGVVYNAARVRLDSVIRLQGFRKRAPFVFRFGGLCGLPPFSVIGYHAPSDSALNAGARTDDLAQFASIPKTEYDQTGAVVFVTGDFNIDTMAGDEIRNCLLPIGADEFFSQASGDGDYVGASLFSAVCTTFKHRADALGFGMTDHRPTWTVDGTELVTMASGFDKIFPFVPSCTGWQLTREVVVPLPYLLPDADTRGKFAVPMIEENGTPVPENFLTTAILSGSLDGMELAEPIAFGATRLANIGLVRARALSDHAPLLADYIFNRSA